MALDIIDGAAVVAVFGDLATTDDAMGGAMGAIFGLGAMGAEIAATGCVCAGVLLAALFWPVDFFSLDPVFGVEVEQPTHVAKAMAENKNDKENRWLRRAGILSLGLMDVYCAGSIFNSKGYANF